MFGLTGIAGHAQTVRPLLAPMAEAAAEKIDPDIDLDERERIRAFAGYRQHRPVLRRGHLYCFWCGAADPGILCAERHRARSTQHRDLGAADGDCRIRRAQLARDEVPTTFARTTQSARIAKVNRLGFRLANTASPAGGEAAPQARVRAEIDPPANHPHPDPHPPAEKEKIDFGQTAIISMIFRVEYVTGCAANSSPPGRCANCARGAGRMARSGASSPRSSCLATR